MAVSSDYSNNVLTQEDDAESLVTEDSAITSVISEEILVLKKKIYYPNDFKLNLVEKVVIYGEKQIHLSRQYNLPARTLSGWVKELCSYVLEKYESQMDVKSEFKPRGATYNDAILNHYRTLSPIVTYEFLIATNLNERIDALVGERKKYKSKRYTEIFLALVLCLAEHCDSLHKLSKDINISQTTVYDLVKLYGPFISAKYKQGISSTVSEADVGITSGMKFSEKVAYCYRYLPNYEKMEEAVLEATIADIKQLQTHFKMLPSRSKYNPMYVAHILKLLFSENFKDGSRVVSYFSVSWSTLFEWKKYIKQFQSQ